MKGNNIKKRIVSLALAAAMLTTPEVIGLAVNAEEANSTAYVQDVDGQVWELDSQPQTYALYAEEETQTDPEVPDAVEPYLAVKENATIMMTFKDDLSYDYAALKQRILDQAVETNLPLTLENTTIKIYSGKVFGKEILTDFSELLKTPGIGTTQFKIEFKGDETNPAMSVIAKITITDRTETSVAVKEGASTTYNMDASKMKQDLFNYAIDWENSNLPDKSTLTVDDFTYEYYATASQLEDVMGAIGGVADIGNIGKILAPVEGGEIKILGLAPVQFNRMPAGEQTVVITYKGNKEYASSTSPEVKVQVNKANVSVRVKLLGSKYFDEAMPENYVTTNPADEFTMIKVYVGINTSLALGTYIELPEALTNNALMQLIDPVVKGIVGQSFTEILNEGVTMKQLVDIFANEDFINIVEKIGIDTGALGDVIKLINQLSNISFIGNSRVAFGTPNKAGLYAIGAVAINKNYNPGIGVGTIAVKMRLKGTHLTWNEGLSGKLTTEEALTYDHGATLTYDGEVVDQSNVKISFSGMTNKLMPYFSTNAPTQPGNYVVTVNTVGGNYIAAPITRTFRIVKA